MVIIGVLFGAGDRGEESDEGENVGKAGRVMLHAPTKRGQVGQGGPPAVEETLQEACQTNFLVWWDGDGAPKGVNRYTSVCYALGGKLAPVVAESESELVCQVVPPGFGLAGSASSARADRAAADEAGAGRVRRRFGHEDRAVDPHDRVQGCGVETTALDWLRDRGRGERGGGGGAGSGTRRVWARWTGAGARRARKRWIHRMRTLSGAGVALAEMSGSEAADEAADAETAHGLVTGAEERVGVAAHDEAPVLRDLAGFIDGEDPGPEGYAGAAREDAEVIGILQVFRKHDIAHVEEGGQLAHRKVPDAPRVLEEIGKPGV